MTLQPALHRFSIRSATAGPIFATIEFLTLALSPLIGSLIYHLATKQEIGAAAPMLTVGAIMAALYLALSHTRGALEVDELRSISLTRPLSRWCFAFLFFAGVAFTFKIGSAFSRGAMITGFLLGASAIVALRLAGAYTINMAFRHKFLEGRRAILLSDGPLPPSVPMPDLMQSGISVHGWFQLPFSDCREDGARFAKECNDVRSFARERHIEDIVVVADAFNGPDLSQMLDQLKVLPLRILLVPTRPLGSIMRPPQPSDATATALTLQTPPFSVAERRTKRLFDLVVGSALLVLASPVLLLVALAIRLDSRGPVLFRQTRVGFCGRQFMIFKFRSMFTAEDGPMIRQAERGDPRITRIGRFLRVTSLDELPQLLNVIIGDMSLIGPRPHALAHDRQYAPTVPGYAWRHHALPGITGWAQVNGHRGETSTPGSMEARIEHDLWYIRNWSIWLDLKILMMTIRAVLKSTNAY